MANRIIFATGNQGKMEEIRQILDGCGMEILSMKEAGIEADVIEDGATFEENACIKAAEIAKLAPQDLILADDSGLEIDYLNKEPGIYSARYLGEDTSYDIKNQALLYRLAGVEKERRSARFVCAVAAAVPGSRVFTTRGTIEGYIGWSMSGANGFGYDPIFYLDAYGCSTAELSMEQKNALSHRGNALRAMKEELLKRGILK
ncbi:MAG: RdgB/HAM1 family non-canonical purine NTP pyrophosphatase [Eubacterium sp.]|nr:RdgB/HAM1 family non-canonical purine NTP pyrophosphatase [Eubacterium sp.]